MFGGLKAKAYRAISSHRDTRLVRLAHRAAQFVEGAYHNEGNDFDVNGERRTLDLLAGFGFRVALDVGANTGAWSRLAAAAWKTGNVHAFEIAPGTARRFRDATAACADRRRIMLHEFGLSDVPGIVPMYLVPHQDDLTCSDPHRAASGSIRFDGEVSTVDAFCRQHRIDHIDFLKIDVEGDEFRVLKGASEMLSGGRISCIQFEYGAFSTDTRFLLKDYYAMLAEKYEIGKIYPQDVQFSDYSWRMEDFRFCNYLCVLKERTDIARRLGG